MFTMACEPKRFDEILTGHLKSVTTPGGVKLVEGELFRACEISTKGSKPTGRFVQVVCTSNIYHSLDVKIGPHSVVCFELVN